MTSMLPPAGAGTTSADSVVTVSNPISDRLDQVIYLLTELLRQQPNAGDYKGVDVANYMYCVESKLRSMRP